MKKLIGAGIAIVMFSCSASKQAAKPRLVDDQTVLLTEVSTDTTYGFSQKNAVQVGGIEKDSGPKNERRYLNALAGPNGEQVTYYRAGSCCPVKSDNGLMGLAMLDRYRVTWEGSKDTVSIFINMYDRGELKAPAGFTIKK